MTAFPLVQLLSARKGIAFFCAGQRSEELRGFVNREVPLRLSRFLSEIAAGGMTLTLG